MDRARHTLSVLGPLDLDLTFGCGQAFRWQRADGGWSGVIGRAEVVARPNGADTLAVEVRGEDPGEESLRRYLRLDEDPTVHLEHAEELRSVPGFLPLLGLRLLRQDPWETLASFICSAAANIQKITTCVEGLARAWGDPIEGSARSAFPPAEAIARVREADLRELGLGFRAPYLLATSRAVSAGSAWSWERLRQGPIEDARARLTDLPGVGPKIADCVLLFALDRLEAFPVDRWIRRATQELSSRRRARDRELAEWARRLGPGRGYLQQILFHLRRTSGPLPALAPEVRRRPATAIRPASARGPSAARRPARSR
ncbi:MAG TPA: DNA glycosylase [Candidatus Eisenbacteria bacterium]|nr:DNA glycosylase [Candidatus Eisenbacteria bacterium]